MSRLGALVGALVRSPDATRWAALGALVMNVVIVITGSAVRLTGSGLGCPSWPACTDDSLEATPELGVHGVIEWSNRQLSGVVAVVSLAALVLAWLRRPRDRGLLWLAGLVVAGIGTQAVVGGITVRTGLNPWVVAGHFLISMGILAAAFLLYRRASTPRPPELTGALAVWAWLVAGVCAAVLVLGTVVTGSGPHAGDPAAGRTGFAPAVVAQLHADAVFLLLGLVVAGWFGLRAAGAVRTGRAALILLGVALAQGFVGFIQYLTDLPILLVGLHVAGACAVWLATVNLLVAGRRSLPG